MASPIAAGLLDLVAEADMNCLDHERLRRARHGGEHR